MAPDEGLLALSRYEDSRSEIKEEGGMSELKRNRYQRKKVVFGFCGPPKYLRNSLVKTNILVLCLRKIMMPGKWWGVGGGRSSLERGTKVHL